MGSQKGSKDSGRKPGGKDDKPVRLAVKDTQAAAEHTNKGESVKAKNVKDTTEQVVLETFRRHDHARVPLANRELSFLAFDERVLDLARDEQVPLLERLRFLCISSSNLDEFFEVRVAGVKQKILGGIEGAGIDGLSPQQELDAITECAHKFVAEQYRLLNDVLLPELATHDIRFFTRQSWDDSMSEWVRQYFNNSIAPVLSPLGLDPAHPFPRLTNKSLTFIIDLEGVDAFGRDCGFALVRAPRSLPRVIPVPESICGTRHGFVFLSSIIHSQIASLFNGMNPRGVYQFKVTRNSELYVSEEEVANLRRALESELVQRNFGQAVRLEVAANCPGRIVKYLQRQFRLDDSDVYRVDGPVNLNRLFAIPDQIDRPELKYPSFTPRLDMALDADLNIFDHIALRSPIVIHHPYESYLPVIELVKQAARDSDVLAIKQTLYRTGYESAFVAYLMEASRAGKDVTVVIELRARFDEEANIRLATRLQEAGIQVVYGVVGFKTHAKMLLIVRREKNKLVRYAHVGTGNYHAATARAYTDISLLTNSKPVTEDVHKVFMQLTGLGKALDFKRLVQAPFALHKFILERIEEETRNAHAGGRAHIIARMNSLVDAGVIDTLYKASQAGVKVELIVRGICMLKAQVPGLSENIRVVSVLGRFLEHSRIFWFHCGGKETLHISSADWMPRNFFSRVEIAVPLEGAVARRVKEECLDLYLADNTFAWNLTASGVYKRLRPDGAEPFCAQQALIDKFSTGFHVD
ncbi:MAG: polyphosphate kinase 1 [Granulosicoccus sp.]